MERVLSTYIYAHQPLAPTLLASIGRAGIHNLEVFCEASHFNYGDPQSVRELASSLNDYGITVLSLHAPTDRDAAGGRGGGVTISIADPERIRRIEAVDEMKRALDVAERIPFRYFALHLASGRQSADGRKFDAAFNSLEHLATFAKARGVTIALQNTPNELGSPSSLAQFIKETHLHNVVFCFDIGHAHIEGGAIEGFHLMRDRTAYAHIHDNHGEKDEHLLPYEGTIDWDAALAGFASAAEALPLVLELKETAPGTPTLDQIRAVFDKLESHLAEKATNAVRE
jgi:sugar phosphate isomerase/epimerase